MPWIKLIREHEADTELKEVYEKIVHQRRGEQINQERTNGGNSPITPSALDSLNPKAMWHTAKLMWEIMREVSLA